MFVHNDLENNSQWEKHSIEWKYIYPSEIKTMAMVLAGGKGNRLYPLTRHRSKPAVPFGGTCRLIDFALSNLVNSGVNEIYVLTQYKSHSLQRHLQEEWTFNHPMNGYLLMPVPPQMRGRDTWYLGTADAIYQNLGLIGNKNPDLVLVFGSDHVYSMNIRTMIQEHIKKQADVTVAAVPMPVSQCAMFGTISVDTNWRVIGFQEKVKIPESIPDQLGQALVSMGNYIFDPKVLVEELEADAADENSTHDFGRDILPKIFEKRRIYVYDFRKNELPGVKTPAAYWRDVGTIQSYYLANMDLINPLSYKGLNNPFWPIRSVKYNGMPLKITESLSGRSGCVENSIIGGSVVVAGGYVKNSVLGNDILIEADAEVLDSVIIGNVVIKEGARIRKTIIDHGNVIEANDSIGFDPDSDRIRFYVDPSGIVVLPHR